MHPVAESGKPVKKKGLSFEQHVELGRKLHAIRERLFSLLETLNAYGSSDKCQRHYVSVINHLDELRSIMDDKLFSEHRGQGRPEIYYPGA